MAGRNEVTRNESSEAMKKSNATISKRLNNLIERKIIIINGNKYDPTHTYSLELK
jgi:predicted transcriptional regulator